MKKIFLVALVSAAVFNATAQTKPKTSPAKGKTTASKPAVKPVALKTKLDSASYAFGVAMGNNLKSSGLETINYELVSKALKDVFAGTAPLLTEQACQNAINNIFEDLSKKKFGPAIKEGETFLAQNKTKPGIKTTASGLQYEVLTAGTGAQPKATDEVTVHYKGTLLNGFEFDSSYKREQPATFGLNQVIPGWTEGVQLMKEGSKYRFFIPYKLAYGARGMGNDIPPFSTLIFEVELIKVAQKQQ